MKYNFTNCKFSLLMETTFNKTESIAYKKSHFDFSKWLLLYTRKDCLVNKFFLRFLFLLSFSFLSLNHQGAWYRVLRHLVLH